MPRPPPPADALRITGNPIRSANLTRSRSSVTTPSDPGSWGSPASRIASLARTLLPIIRIMSGRGPIQPKPECWTISANSAFSLRNPYPGWMASAPETSAAERIAGMLR